MDVSSVAHNAGYTMLMVTWCHFECCCAVSLDFEAAGGSIIVCTIICFEGIKSCKHDVGALL